MNNELLLLIKKLTHTLIQQTKTRPQETLEFKMNKRMQAFSFIPPINLVEEDKCLLAVSSFECTNSVFNITNKNNSFSIIIPGHYPNKDEEVTIERLNTLLERRPENGIELHVDEVKYRGHLISLGGEQYKLSDLGTKKQEIFGKLKKYSTNQSLTDMVFRLQLTYHEIMDILNFKYIPTKTTEYALTPGIYEIVDLNNTLTYFT